MELCHRTNSFEYTAALGTHSCRKTRMKTKPPHVGQQRWVPVSLKRARRAAEPGADIGVKVNAMFTTDDKIITTNIYLFIKFAGSWNIISAISTTGVSYSAVVNGTTNQSIFICYIEKLMKLVNKIESIPYSKVLLMMDNAPWHQARNVLKFLEEIRIRYIFIPQYSPELAPVEKFFAQMKQKVIKAEHDSFNLTKDWVIIMRATLKSISQANVRLLWRNFYSWIRNLICDYGELEHHLYYNNFLFWNSLQ